MTGRKHGLVGTPEYGAWHSMKCRYKVDGIVRRKS